MNRICSILLISLLSLSFVGAASAEKPGKPIFKATKMGYPDPKTKHGFKRIISPTRAGRQAQMFELRHGDCGSDHGWSDCENDRQRYERAESPQNRIQKVGQATWYGFSIFLPNNFRDIGPANTIVGQIIMNGWREPLWFLNLREGRLRVMFAELPECTAAKIKSMRGQWTDITIFADYRYSVPGESFAIYINGKKACSKQGPLVTPRMVAASKGSLYFKYGIYNGYVSRWLSKNRRKQVKAKTFNDLHSKSGLVNKSAAKTPFAYDWGVTLPTQIVIYDEMRFGGSREQVDVQLLTRAGVRPVD